MEFIEQSPLVVTALTALAGGVLGAAIAFWRREPAVMMATGAVIGSLLFGLAAFFFSTYGTVIVLGGLALILVYNVFS